MPEPKVSPEISAEKEVSEKVLEIPPFGEVGVGKPRLSVIGDISQSLVVFHNHWWYFTIIINTTQPDRRDIPVPLDQQEV